MISCVIIRIAYSARSTRGFVGIEGEAATKKPSL